MKILFLSAEVAPYAKAGGLGDVAGALPKALRAMGHDVRVVMPAYAAIENGYPGVESMELTLEIPVRERTEPAGFFSSTLPRSDVPIYFVGQWNLFNRDRLYGYEDDPYRFAFYCRAALELTAALDWRPDLVHANDWHAAPAIVWLANAGHTRDFFRDIPTLFSIHNLAHQGECDWDIFDYMNVWSYGLDEEPYGRVNFMARGIHHATLVNTVSPTYAEEIKTPAGGAGLDNLLRARSFDLHGILNGIDTDVWDPATDERLPVHYDVDHLDDRAAAKEALQGALGLPRRPDVPLLGMVSRLAWQKGLDIMGHPLHLLLNGYAGDAQVVILGTGEAEYESMLAHLAEYHDDRMRAILEFRADLAPLIYAGSDMFLMPSRFEPCGLGQLIAMRYGSVPVVRETGGLMDTIQDSVTGFTFRKLSSEDFWLALQRAIYVYNVNRPHWRNIQINGMRSDYSWERAAEGYGELYAWAQARIRGYG